MHVGRARSIASPVFGWLFSGMAELTARAGILLLVAIHAASHGGHIRRRRENIHFRDFAVAHFTFHSRRQM